MNFAIVEDQDEEAKRLQDYIFRYGKENNLVFSLKRFSDGSTFLSGYQPIYDVVFMDVEMPGTDGMSAAEKLRAIDTSVVLVFVTKMRQYALKGYSVQAYDFIVKPIDYEKFEFHFRRILDVAKKTKHDHYVVFTNQNEKIKVDSKTIQYVEVLDHRTIVHAGNKEIEIWKPLYQVQEQLKDEDFVLINACYLVNLAYVSAVEGDYAILGDKKLKISRAKRKDFISQLMTYLRQRG